MSALILVNQLLGQGLIKVTKKLDTDQTIDMWGWWQEYRSVLQFYLVSYAKASKNP